MDLGSEHALSTAEREAPVRHGRALWRRLALAAAAAGLAASASGCGLAHLQDLNFRVDDRLHFVSPSDRSTQQRPVTVSWTMRDFTVEAPGSAAPSRDAGYFAVFVDRAPIKPEETLAAVGKGDPTCARDPKCPTTAYLHQHYVFPTTQTHLTVRFFPPVSGHDHLQMHTITVVLLDTAGHRIGESAWELDVRLPRIGVS
jgi:hypothetical protein